jgi:putative two-component system response regulator
VAQQNETIDQIEQSGADPGVTAASKILVVDDEDMVRSTIVNYLNFRGTECLEASNVSAALETFESHQDEIDAILSDLKMPGQSGLDLLSELRARGHKDIEFVIMTGYADINAAISALRNGASDFLQKPVEFDTLYSVLQQARTRHALRRSQRDFRLDLITKVKRKATEIRTLAGSVDTAYEDSVRHLAVAAEFRDSETGAHILRIGAYSEMIAGKLGWPPKAQHEISLAAPLHDIGKIGIPDKILMKEGPLTPEEFDAIKEHCMIGHKILSVSEQPVMMTAAEIALAHHERWDGTGYPAGLRGTEIPLPARIVSIGDVYDALRSPRPYKPPMGHDDVVKIILYGDDRTRPTHFDPDMLEILLKHGETPFAHLVRTNRRWATTSS